MDRDRIAIRVDAKFFNQHTHEPLVAINASATRADHELDHHSGRHQILQPTCAIPVAPKSVYRESDRDPDHHSGRHQILQPTCARFLWPRTIAGTRRADCELITFRITPNCSTTARSCHQNRSVQRRHWIAIWISIRVDTKSFNQHAHKQFVTIRNRSVQGRLWIASWITIRVSANFQPTCARPFVSWWFLCTEEYVDLWKSLGTRETMDRELDHHSDRHGRFPTKPPQLRVSTQSNIQNRCHPER